MEKKYIYSLSQEEILALSKRHFQSIHPMIRVSSFLRCAHFPLKTQHTTFNVEEEAAPYRSCF